MSSSVRPELLTCVGSSASLQTRPSPLIYRGLTVQTNRATSFRTTQQLNLVNYSWLNRLAFLSLQAFLIKIKPSLHWQLSQPLLLTLA